MAVIHFKCRIAKKFKYVMISRSTRPETGKGEVCGRYLSKIEGPDHAMHGAAGGPDR
jgi:hypothetical protein